MTKGRTLGATLLVAGLAAAPAQAQTPPVDLTNATIEDLLKMTVVSASRKEQPAEDVPAAVTGSPARLPLAYIAERAVGASAGENGGSA